jgi:hypothetical protein
MPKEETVDTFNKKIFPNEDYNSIDVDNQKNYDSDDDKEIFDEYYQDNSISFIEEELVKYIETNFIPLCEYINKDNLEKFLGKIIKDD